MTTAAAFLLAVPLSVLILTIRDYARANRA